MGAEGLRGAGVLVPAAGLLAHGDVLAPQAPAQPHRIVGDDLPGLDARALVGEGALRRGDLPHGHLARGHVHEGQAADLPGEAHGQQVGVALFVQQGGLRHRAGGHHADHVAADQPLGQGGVLHLLADGDLEAALHELLHIGIHRVMGHAGHGRALLQPALLAGQRQLQLLGHGHRVVKEHLIKIPHAVEEQAAGILLLHLEVVLHHGGQLLHLQGRQRCGGCGLGHRRNRSSQTLGCTVIRSRRGTPRLPSS